jgi:copper chaperone CopZ
MRITQILAPMVALLMGSWIIDGNLAWSFNQQTTAVQSLAAALSSPSEFSTSNPNFQQERTVVFQVKGLLRPKCASDVKIALQELKGVHATLLKPQQDLVEVTYDSYKVTLDALKEAVHEAGYQAIISQVKPRTS